MRIRLLSAAGVLALLLGCGRKPAPVEAPKAQPILAATGGVVGEAGGAQVTVPPGALSKDAVLSVARQSRESHASAGVRVIGSVWTLQVDGAEHYKFAKPVTIAVPFDPALRTAGSTVGLSVWTGDRWQRVSGAHVDAAAGTVVARVDHFSEYAPTEGELLAPPPVPPKGQGYLDNEFWYCRLTVAIHGSGTKRGKYGEQQTYTVSRDAELKFRLRAVPGELAMVSALDEIKKKAGIPLPPEALRGLEKAKTRRHWITETVNPGPDEFTDVQITVKDSLSTSSPAIELGELKEEAESGSMTLDGGYSVRSLLIHSLEIDLDKGTYSFGLGTLSGGLLKFHSAMPGAPEKNSEEPTGLEVQIKDQKLPGDGGALGGSRRIPRDKFDHTVKGVQGSWLFPYGRERGLLSWTFSPVPLDDVELVLSIPGYDDWMPRGGASESQKGNSLPVEARLRNRKGGSAKAKMVRLNVRLKEVSNEPGVCLNLPLHEGEKTFDLQFAPGSGYTVEDKGTRVLKHGSEFDRLNLNLDCYDWGAWGTLVAEAELKDGRMLWAKLDTDPSMDEILVPKRDENSKIADKWKTLMKAEGLTDTDDKDPQNGNSHDGDGLTMYEEYRGIIAKGKHTREHPPGAGGFRPFSPRRKDLVLCNTITGEPAVIAGLRLLEKAAGITVVEVDDQELPASRIVNLNTGTLTCGPQRGLRLYNVALPGSDVGLTNANTRMPAGSREQYDRVQVDLNKIRKIYQGDAVHNWSVATEISETVAHEIAHALDLVHHGEGNPVTLQHPEKLYIYDASRKRIHITDMTGNGQVGEPGTQASGDVRCIMCYNDVYAWGYHSPSYLFFRTLNPPGSIFCTSKDGTGHNADFEIDDPEKPGHPKKIPGVFGKASTGPCLPMMRIKDQAK